ncbi:hypothetical protein [Ephemeroptericola cinctiostellae]|nr:hypothetical protein [Ephemeroptericola cinctiostellae]
MNEQEFNALQDAKIELAWAAYKATLCADNPIPDEDLTENEWRLLKQVWIKGFMSGVAFVLETEIPE